MEKRDLNWFRDQIRTLHEVSCAYNPTMEVMNCEFVTKASNDRRGNYESFELNFNEMLEINNNTEDDIERKATKIVLRLNMPQSYAEIQNNPELKRYDNWKYSAWGNGAMSCRLHEEDDGLWELECREGDDIYWKDYN